MTQVVSLRCEYRSKISRITSSSGGHGRPVRPPSPSECDPSGVEGVFVPLPSVHTARSPSGLRHTLASTDIVSRVANCSRRTVQLTSMVSSSVWCFSEDKVNAVHPRRCEARRPASYDVCTACFPTARKELLKGDFELFSSGGMTARSLLQRIVRKKDGTFL